MHGKRESVVVGVSKCDKLEFYSLNFQIDYNSRFSSDMIEILIFLSITS